MRASCSSDIVDDFDDFNEKILYSSPKNCISVTNNDFPFDNEFCDDIIKKEDFQNEEKSINKIIEYNPELANLISNELGLNHSQTSRKNAWGNLSYAELITKAILNSYQQRLTLSQIYSWIILYVPYFRDKSDKKSSIGWKNSIRHNLSLHNRFVRIPNEIAGKSSWWTIDLRVKQIRGRRKNQSNENCKRSFQNSNLLTNQKSSFTSVRDINQSLYSNLQNQTQISIPNILHDMLKSSPLQTSNSENDKIHTTINCPSSSSSSISNNITIDNDDDEMISLKLNKEIKTMDRSNPLFRRMVLTLMRHQMNKNKRNKILSTPPPSSISPSSSNQHFQLNQNSTFDLDVQTILDFERTTFGDEHFDIHDLPNL